MLHHHQILNVYGYHDVRGIRWSNNERSYINSYPVHTRGCGNGELIV
jgi:hypothetical protein